MNPVPPLNLVAALARFDRDLRIRWARHQRHWVIEIKLPERQPGRVAERPNPFSETPRGKDTWEGWQQGWMYVTKLPHPIPYPTEFVIQHLKHLSLEAHRAKDALIERLDAAEAEDEARIKREWDVINEQGAKELFDRLAWDSKRQISTHVAGPNPRRVDHDGFTTYDRRAVVAMVESASAQETTHD